MARPLSGSKWHEPTRPGFLHPGRGWGWQRSILEREGLVGGCLPVGPLPTPGRGLTQPCIHRWQPESWCAHGREGLTKFSLRQVGPETRTDAETGERRGQVSRAQRTPGSLPSGLWVSVRPAQGQSSAGRDPCCSVAHLQIGSSCLLLASQLPMRCCPASPACFSG